MVYQFLKIVFRISQFFYFKKIEIIGTNNIPVNEANLIIANHPSSFQDPILIGLDFKKPIHFLTAEEFMGKGLTYKFIENHIKAIPIYRATTRPDEVHKNTDSFSKCYEALAQHKNILIFPEGFSDTQTWLSEIKTGTARIAIDTLKQNPNLTKLNIIPVGLNYSNPHQFRSSFLLNIGEIIQLNQSHTHDKYTLTKLCYTNLRKSINGLDINEVDWQEALLVIIKSNQDNLQLKQNFNSDSKFITKLDNLNHSDQIVFEKLKSKSIALKDSLEQLNITLKNYINYINPPKQNNLKQLLFSVLFIPGYIMNGLPLILVEKIVNNKEMKYSFKGGLFFALGTFISLIWHLIIVIVFSYYIGWASLIVPFILLLFGYITLKCRDFLKPINDYKKLKKYYSTLNKNELDKVQKSFFELEIEIKTTFN